MCWEDAPAYSEMKQRDRWIPKQDEHQNNPIESKRAQLCHHYFLFKKSLKSLEIRGFFCIFAEEFDSTKKFSCRTTCEGMTANRQIKYNNLKIKEL